MKTKSFIDKCMFISNNTNLRVILEIASWLGLKMKNKEKPVLYLTKKPKMFIIKMLKIVKLFEMVSCVPKRFTYVCICLTQFKN